jgi:hypothetical protein
LGRCGREWYVVLILALGIPLALFPAVLVLYLNLGGIYQIMRNGTSWPRCLDRKLKLLISISLAPLVTLVAAAFLLAVAFVSIPLLIVGSPAIIAVGLPAQVSTRTIGRLRRVRSHS